LLVSGPVAQEKQGIWIISVIGATLKKIRDDAFDASLSPDGSQIVFRDSVARDIWLMNADGGQARSVLKPEEGYFLFSPTWFPNGKRILYSKYHQDNGEVSLGLESRDLKGGDLVPLLSNPQLTDLCWGQSGQLIYSVRERPPNQYDSNLWEVRLDEESGKPRGNPRRLTDWTGFFFSNLDFTADGNRFVFLNIRPQSDVYAAELGNGGSELKAPQRVTLDERTDWPGGWSLDSKTLFLYSDRNGNFDIYKQGVNERNAEPIATGSDEKWAPQISPDGKWLLYMQWPKAAADGTVANSGKIMRSPVAGGPAEAVMDIKGHPDILFGDPTYSVAGFPSFRCRLHAPSGCMLAEKGDKQIIFTAFDPLQGRKAELTRVSVDPDFSNWDLSPGGTRIAISVFDYKATEIQIAALAGGTPQKLSAMPWTELAAVAWAADGKSLFLARMSSRGTSVVHMPVTGGPKLLFKQPSWDIFSLLPSPDGRYLAFGPVITTANAWTIASFPRR
jgi:dipeptidyl aminopeptidase/acylaminoacyl peptidase